jgi:hypothetical protein
MSNKYSPIQGQNIGALVSQINRNFAALDKEVVTKSFGGKNGTDGVTIGRTGEVTSGMVVTQNDKKVLEIGTYRDGRAGLIIYDENEVPIGLFGQAPDDARVGAWVASGSNNVLTLLGG